MIAALLSDDPVEGLRAPVNRIRTANAMTFITVMDVHGIRLAHPNEAQIGQPFIGDISGALRGETVSEEIVGTYGPLMQVNRGIRGPDGAIIAVVSAGQEESRVRQSALETSGTLLAIIGGAGIVAVGLALWFGRRVNQQTHGLSAGEITRLWTYHHALLASVTQGMILIAEDGEIRLINAAARRLLGLAEDASVASVADLGLGETLAALLTSGAEASGEVHVVGPRLLMVNQTPAELPHGGWWRRSRTAPSWPACRNRSAPSGRSPTCCAPASTTPTTSSTRWSRSSSSASPSAPPSWWRRRWGARRRPST